MHNLNAQHMNILIELSNINLLRLKLEAGEVVPGVTLEKLSEIQRKLLKKRHRLVDLMEINQDSPK